MEPAALKIQINRMVIAVSALGGDNGTDYELDQQPCPPNPCYHRGETRSLIPELKSSSVLVQGIIQTQRRLNSLVSAIEDT